MIREFFIIYLSSLWVGSNDGKGCKGYSNKKKEGGGAAVDIFGGMGCGIFGEFICMDGGVVGKYISMGGCPRGRRKNIDAVEF